MNKLFLFIISLFILLSCSDKKEYTISFNHKKEVIDSSLTLIDDKNTKKFLLDFIFDASNNDIEYSKISYRLNQLYGIFILDLTEYKLLGLTLCHRTTKGLILLDITLLEDLKLFKFVLYHELGHWFGLTHCDCSNSIMLNKYSNKKVNILIENWDQSVINFMKDLKEIL